MAVPRNRHSNARKKSRQAHFVKSKQQIGTCSNCFAPALSHHICPSCGYYGKKEIIAPKTSAE
ncbi:MAG: 50S ribosomal protein L32 [Parachlamydiales bacterium]|nr:50S ribosomal protein L32 [Parachlamydiales bacterium]